MKPLLRELYGKTDAHLFLCNWYDAIRDSYFEIFEHMEDHAGEMETSFMLAYYPELVATNDDGTLNADDAVRADFQFEALTEGWVSITRPWHLLTSNSGAAYPHSATAEKGERMMKLVVERLSAFIVDLSNAPVDDSFPFKPRS